MNRKHGITVGTLVLVVLACAWHGGEAAADGVMMPPLVVDKLPDMPSQRAILVHRDGVETLVIESMFDGPGKEMAWILPVPAKPTKITQACSGLFTTLDLNLQPKVIDAVSPVLFLGLLFLFWFLFLVAAGRFVPLRALAMAVFVLFAICKDMAGNAKAGVVAEHKVPGVSSSGALTVGGYEVHVLEAEAPAALSQWLQANAFRDIPEAGKPVVSDYIAKKWQFCRGPVAAGIRWSEQAAAAAAQFCVGEAGLPVTAHATGLQRLTPGLVCHCGQRSRRAFHACRVFGHLSKVEGGMGLISYSSTEPGAAFWCGAGTSRTARAYGG